MCCVCTEDGPGFEAILVVQMFLLMGETIIASWWSVTETVEAPNHSHLVQGINLLDMSPW